MDNNSMHILQTSKTRSADSSDDRTYRKIALRGRTLYFITGKYMLRRILSEDRSHYETEYEEVDRNCKADLFAFGEHLYWRDEGTKILWRGTTHRGTLLALHVIDRNCIATDLAATPTRMFWLDEGSNKVICGLDCYERHDKDGHLQANFSYELPWSHDLMAADGDYLFGMDREDEKVYRYLATQSRLQLDRVLTRTFPPGAIDLVVSEGWIAILYPDGVVVTYNSAIDPKP